MKRELANKMYTPSAYFLGRFLSNLILQMIYPFIMVIMLFWAMGIQNTSKQFILMSAFAATGNAVFCAQGYFLGIMA